MSRAVITFMVENWHDVAGEIVPLWPAHNAEIAAEDDRSEMDPDLRRYAALAGQGKLFVLVARDRGRVAGYLFAVIETHLHRKGTLCAFFDLYFLLTEHRKGWTGIRMFREAERALKSRGVQKMYTGTKLSKDVSVIFARLGWVETERLFTRRIGG